MKKIALLLFVVYIFVGCSYYDEEHIGGKYDNGMPTKIEYYNVIDGEKQKVKEVRFFPNGEKEFEAEYLNGELNGESRQWYSNGNLWVEEGYLDGLKHGAFTVYSDDGEKSFSGEYDEGVKKGRWNFWDNKGNLVKSENY